MANSTPALITEEQYNQSVKSWAIKVRKKSVGNINSNKKHNSREWEKRQTKKLSKSISLILREDYGTISIVRFKFQPQGIFFHYGVGRGYVKEGDRVRRKVSRSLASTSRRHPVDWLDVEIRTGMKQLADVVQDYYGDIVMNEILSQMDKAQIEK